MIIDVVGWYFKFLARKFGMFSYGLLEHLKKYGKLIRGNNNNIITNTGLDTLNLKAKFWKVNQNPLFLKTDEINMLR